MEKYGKFDSLTPPTGPTNYDGRKDNASGRIERPI